MGVDPFAEGLEARESGKPLASNPYPKGSAEAEAWLQGWSSHEAVDDGAEPAADEQSHGLDAL